MPCPQLLLVEGGGLFGLPASPCGPAPAVPFDSPVASTSNLFPVRTLPRCCLGGPFTSVSRSAPCPQLLLVEGGGLFGLPASPCGPAPAVPFDSPVASASNLFPVRTLPRCCLGGPFTSVSRSAPCPQLLLVEGGGFEPPKLSRQIYSLIPLATREPLPKRAYILFLALGLVNTFWGISAPKLAT